jgi:hypothetical protein
MSFIQELVQHIWNSRQAIGKSVCRQKLLEEEALIEGEVPTSISAYLSINNPLRVTDTVAEMKHRFLI